MAEFTLTGSEDTIVGSSRNDQINGGPGTLQTQDTIDGGGGFDTLVADAEQNGAQAPTITNVEDIFVDTGGLAFDISNIVGTERIISDNASATFVGINQEDLSVRFGARSVGSGTVTLDFADGALTATDTLVKLEATDSNVTFKPETDIEAGRIELIDLVVSGAENQVDLSAFPSIEELTISGEATSKIVVDSSELELIDASETTGGVTLTSDIAGDQTVLGGSGDDDFKTGAGNDTIVTAQGDDVVNAGGGDNKVTTGNGADEVFTEQGNDDIDTGRGTDFVSAGSGDDVIRTGRGDDEVLAGDGADIVYGGSGDDDIRGQGGADTIYDGKGNDIVRGGGDNDTFYAGKGDDEFIGGGGVDQFIFTEDKFNNDVVSDFTLTETTSTNDVLIFSYEGTVRRLQSQEEFEMFVDNNPKDTSFDANTDTISIDTDLGQITLQVSDADFLLM